LCTRFGITVEDLIEDVTVVAQQLNNVFLKEPYMQDLNLV